MSYWQRLEAEKARKRQEKAERKRQAEQERRKLAVNVETLPTAKPAAIAVKERPLLRKDLENRERFIRWFSHPWNSIEKRGDGNWKTLPYPLLPAAIFEGWRDGDRLIGLGFGGETNYFVLDIDSGSEYHNEAAIGEMKAALEGIGINGSVLIQSSFSTGRHLFVPLPESIPTFPLACALHYCLEDAGFNIQKGQLELFPNRKKYVKDGKSIYNRLRLPLQPGSGSFLLDDDFCPFSDSIEIFLDLLDRAAQNNDLESLLEASEASYRRYLETKKQESENTSLDVFGFFSLEKIGKNAKQWKRNLEAAIAQGWTGNHQSNELLGRIAEYGRVFLGLGGEELARYVLETAIASPGYEIYCRHQKPKEIEAWCRRWAKCAEKYRYPYGTRKGGQFKRLGKGGLTNEEKKADAMERIIEAVQDFELSGRAWPRRIHDRRFLIAKLAHCSERTLIKPEYLALWHPNHRTPVDNDPIKTSDHTLAINCLPDGLPACSEKNFYSSLQSGSDRQDQPSKTGDLLLCTTPSTPRKEQNATSQAQQGIQPLEPKKQPKSVSKVVSMNRFRQSDGFQVGDHVICPEHPGHILEIVAFHLEETEWVKIRGDWWPPGETELSHVSELKKVEDNHVKPTVNGDRPERLPTVPDSGDL